MDFRGDGGAVVCHRHRLGAVADRLRGSSESGDGVEEGMNLGKMSKKGKISLEKCQKSVKIPWKSVKNICFLSWIM